jgi:hypothetical protein
VSDPLRPDDAPSASGAGGTPPVGPDPNLPAWARKQRVADPLTDERLEAFIGPRWPRYQKKFAQFREDPSFVPTWNWSAALFGSAWFVYRKLYLPALAFMLVPGLIFRLLTESDAQMTMAELQKPENSWLAVVQAGVTLSAMIASGGLGNWLLFRRARTALKVVAVQSLPEAEALPWLARVGGINRLGLSLIVAVSLMLGYASLSA